jgi:hypothetical protein
LDDVEEDNHVTVHFLENLEGGNISARVNAEDTV